VKDCHPLWIGSPSWHTEETIPFCATSATGSSVDGMPESAVLVRMSMNSLALGLTGTDTPASVEATLVK